RALASIWECQVTELGTAAEGESGSARLALPDADAHNSLTRGFPKIRAAHRGGSRSLGRPFEKHRDRLPDHRSENNHPERNMNVEKPAVASPDLQSFAEQNEHTAEQEPQRRDSRSHQETGDDHLADGDRENCQAGYFVKFDG